MGSFGKMGENCANEHFSAVRCIGNTLLGESYLIAATLPPKMPKNALIRGDNFHPSTQMIP